MELFVFLPLSEFAENSNVRRITADYLGHHLLRSQVFSS